MIKETPPPISTGDPDSFAYRTIYIRKPLIIDQVIKNNALSDKDRQNLIDFKNDVREGTVINPFSNDILNNIPANGDNPATGDNPIEAFSNSENSAHFEKGEVQIWKDEIKKYSGKTWFEIPWYFAEAYFYLRLLITFGYYSPKSHNYMQDPFESLKNIELHTETGGIDILKSILDIVKDIEHPAKDIEHPAEVNSAETNSVMVIKPLILFSLWGNRIDLSNYHIAQNSKQDTLISQNINIIIDHSKELPKRLIKARKIDFILDNTGQELVCDLALIWYLFKVNKDRKNFRIVLHVKKSPFFVSDTMKKDVEAVLNTFAVHKQERIREFGEDLSKLLHSGKLKVMAHYFWNGPLHFPDMPDDLLKSLKNSSLVIIKGDANYRRLLSDRKWKPWESMREITDYFPASFAVLRTMKSEIVLDIEKKLVESMFKEDKEWMVNGKRGIIQLIEKK